MTTDSALHHSHGHALPPFRTAAKKREMEDNTKKIGQLFWRLNQGDVSEGVVPKLVQLCQAIDTGDWVTANHIQVCVCVCVCEGGFSWYVCVLCVLEEGVFFAVRTAQWLARSLP